MRRPSLPTYSRRQAPGNVGPRPHHRVSRRSSRESAGATRAPEPSASGARGASDRPRPPCGWAAPPELSQPNLTRSRATGGEEIAELDWQLIK
eukprot:4532874-Pyramimonas_sp.AAC.1